MKNKESMTIIKVSDVIGDITTISHMNSYRYKDIKAEMAKVGDTDILLDFYYVELVKPETDPDFIDIINDKRVHVRLYNNEELYKTIKFMLLLSNAECNYDDKVENIVRCIEAPPGVREKEQRRIFKIVDDTYELCDGIGRINLCSAISVINRNTYVDGIREVIIAHSGETKTFELLLHKMEIVKSQFEALSVLIVTMADLGIKLQVLTSDEEVDKIVTTYLNLGMNKNLTIEERLALLTEMVEPKTVGMLTTYVKGGKKDIFGRSGNAVPATTLPAIYLRHDREFAYFKVFREKTFSRRLEYSFRHDSEEHPGLNSVERKIRLAELGICASCVGSRYHFNMPLQYDNNGMHKVYVDDIGEDDFKIVNVSLPQYIKMVLDDWDEDYNVSELFKAIKVTKDRLRQNGIYL